MKNLIFLTFILNLVTTNTLASACNSKYSDGSRPTEHELFLISKNNEEWYQEFKTVAKRIITEDFTVRIASEMFPEIKVALNDKRRANLCGANLSEMSIGKINLAYGNLSNTNLFKTNFIGTNLEYADFSDAYMQQANLKNAATLGASFENAYLAGMDFSDQYIVLQNFNNAFLYGVDFSNATLMNVSLRNAVLSGANMMNTLYEPSSGSEPRVIPPPINIETIKFEHSPHGLIYMREQFRKNGLKEEERKITFAINSHIPKVTNKETLITEDAPTLEYWIKYIAFDATTRWGLEPGRSLKLLLFFILLFSIPYYISLLCNGNDRIWRAWEKDRIRQDLGSDKPEKIIAGKIKSVYIATYFSVISAFHFGWRDINVSGWIARIQPQEYTYVATGWVRIVSGIQSLVSIYLLVMWILTYFGSPFM